jgi:hypothetical protein
VQIEGAAILVLGYAKAKRKRAVERAFGISDRPDLEAVAERHLPAALAGGS